MLFNICNVLQRYICSADGIRMLALIAALQLYSISEDWKSNKFCKAKKKKKSQIKKPKFDSESSFLMTFSVFWPSNNIFPPLLHFLFYGNRMVKWSHFIFNTFNSALIHTTYNIQQKFYLLCSVCELYLFYCSQFTMNIQCRMAKHHKQHIQ